MVAYNFALDWVHGNTKKEKKDNLFRMLRDGTKHRTLREKNLCFLYLDYINYT